MKKAKNPWINLLFLAITLVINALGALGIINGFSQKEISQMFLTLITPSPAAFGIWGVIYALLILSVIVMIVKKDSTYYRDAINQISDLFRISCIFNSLWIIAFSYIQIELSVILIFGFLITLSLICEKLLKLSGGNEWLLPLTFGMYTGWLFIASVVNTATMLVKLNWNGFNIRDDIWAAIILIVSILLGYFVVSKLKNAIFPIPISWAYLGIYQFLKAPEGFNGAYGVLQNYALVGAFVLVAISIYQFYKNNFSLLPYQKN